MNTLAQSAEAYTEGRIATASAIAQECLLHAQLHGDRRLEAQSLWQMAQVHMVCGEIESALSEGQNALLLFEALADREGETRSLITVAYAATQLRDNGLALASAGRAQRLSEGLGSPVLQAAANNYLGVALFWDGDSDASDASLRVAMELARRGAGRSAQVRPMVNRATGALVNLTFDRVFNDLQPDPSRLGPLVDELSGCDLTGAMPFLSAGMQVDCEAISAWPHIFAACWREDVAFARECLDLCASRAASGRLALRWIVPYVAWARHEFACATRDWPEAVRLADDVVNSATRIQNQQMVWLGSVLKLRTLETMGLTNEAARGWRVLIQRDMAQRRRRRANGAWPLQLQHRVVRNGQSAAPPSPWADRSAAQGARHRRLAEWETRYGLTRAEAAVLDLLGQGLPPARIAEMRHTSVGTVRTQLKSLFDKTGLRSQQALIAALGGTGDEMTP